MAGTRTLEELVDTKEPAWPDVQAWIRAAKVPVEILPGLRKSGERTLVALQVTTRSPMGAIALESGGLLVDRGWLRFLGGGGPRMKGDLAGWNALDGTPREREPAVLVVAHDVLGGFFALNGGGLRGKTGNVHYFAPDRLDWEDLGSGYSAVLRGMLDGTVGRFYEGQRWKNWEVEVAVLDADKGFSFAPPLFTREARAGLPSRRAVPMRELWDFQMDMRRQLDEKGVKTGDRIRLEVVK